MLTIHSAEPITGKEEGTRYQAEGTLFTIMCTMKQTRQAVVEDYKKESSKSFLSGNSSMVNGGYPSDAFEARPARTQAQMPARPAVIPPPPTDEQVAADFLKVMQVRHRPTTPACHRALPKDTRSPSSLSLPFLHSLPSVPPLRPPSQGVRAGSTPIVSLSGKDMMTGENFMQVRGKASALVVLYLPPTPYTP